VAPLFRKLLVANRGEIAVRVMRACRELEIPSAAVYSDADRNALHVRLADEAYHIGPSPASQSYLDIERIISAARAAGADAIHPGYGFLSENPRFADACANAGISFVGPSGRTMGLLGNKIAARKLAREHDVPVAPGTDEVVNPEEARRVADEIGYPVLIKAAAGGGGRGIRHVQSADEMAQALQVAGNEAQTAFGDRGVFVEKYLSPVRHIEVQVIADTCGNTIALPERECSIQRRHQKLIEESPSPVVDLELRRRLAETAVRMAKAAGYVNAGTCEFLLDQSGNFYFLEMNTRLQVEHPVTELITGADLVIDQIRVAAGKPLRYPDDPLAHRGWAIECRINAEDPAMGFVPSVGTVRFVREPAGPGVRLESALYDGFAVTEFYDSMVAKLIAYGGDRRTAIERMRRALNEFHVVGIRTNIPFHLAMMSDERFIAGEMDTGFLDRAMPAPPPGREGAERAALVAAAILRFQRQSAGARPVATTNNHAPRGGWRGLGRAAALATNPGAGGWRRPIV
jgi:acetyl-CoA carboxylase biotin carboxylase subunit